MRKIDYLTLTAELKRRIEAPRRADMLSEHWQQNGPAIESAAFEAASMARYLAEHLHVNRAAFLLACGLKP